MTRVLTGTLAVFNQVRFSSLSGMWTVTGTLEARDWNREQTKERLRSVSMSVERKRKILSRSSRGRSCSSITSLKHSV